MAKPGIVELLNVDGFMRSLNDFDKFTGASIKKFQRAAIIKLHSILISSPGNGGTPIDTGRARGSWSITRGRRGKFMLPVSPTKKRWGKSPLYYKWADVKKFQKRVTPSTVQLGDRWYVFNNLPYIERLEEGYSPQAKYFARDAYLKTREEIQKAMDAQLLAREIRQAQRHLDRVMGRLRVD